MIYLEALRDPRLRRPAESALIAIRDRAGNQIASAAAQPRSPADAAVAASLERVLTRFEPIREWRVIGPFPRTTPQVFLGERTIDFARSQIGAATKPISCTP